MWEIEKSVRERDGMWHNTKRVRKRKSEEGRDKPSEQSEKESNVERN